MKILIAYDGSANADHAIAVAGKLFPGAEALVVHAWEPVALAAARAAVYLPDYGDGQASIDREREQAEGVARQGAELATAAGLTASSAALQATGPLWAAIVDCIAEEHPDLTVMGTRGLTGVRGALAGSVSHAVVSHAHAPVLTVPLEEPARKR
jgi:nucleotide-binding universal stress UspA family protein